MDQTTATVQIRLGTAKHLNLVPDKTINDIKVLRMANIEGSKDLREKNKNTLVAIRCANKKIKRSLGEERPTRSDGRL